LIEKLEVKKERREERFIPDYKERLSLEIMENVAGEIPAKRVLSGYEKRGLGKPLSRKAE
jgi:hypothetical protein